MKKKNIMIGLSLLLLLAGCAQESQKVQVKTEKQSIYTPMNLSKEVPKVKHESIVDIDKKDMVQYERDQKYMSDFDKHMQARERKLRNK